MQELFTVPVDYRAVIGKSLFDLLSGVERDRRRGSPSSASNTVDFACVAFVATALACLVLVWGPFRRNVVALRFRRFGRRLERQVAGGGVYWYAKQKSSMSTNWGLGAERPARQLLGGSRHVGAIYPCQRPPPCVHAIGAYDVRAETKEQRTPAGCGG